MILLKRSPPLTCDDEPDCAACVDCSVAPDGPCDALADACSADSDCVAISLCYDDCVMDTTTDDEFNACWDNCAAIWPDAAQPFVDYANCVFDECPNACS